MGKPSLHTERDRPIDADTPRHHGTVVRVIADKGFCFVKSDEDSNEYFLHFSNTTIPWGDVQKGTRLSFINTYGQKGYRAIDARAE